MQVVELPPGEKAPEGADRVIITQTGNGTFDVNGVVARDTIAIFFGPELFASDADALTAGLAWADHKGVEMLFVERTA